MKIVANLALIGAAVLMVVAPAVAQSRRADRAGINRPAAMNVNNRQIRAVANSSINRGGYNAIGNRPGLRPGSRPNVVVVNNNRRPGGYGNGGYGYNNGYNNNNWQNDRNDRDNLGEFIGKTAAITAGVAAVTAIAKSGNNNSNNTSQSTSSVNEQECEQQISNGQVYVNCNGTWYQPVQMGTQTNYQQSQGPR